MFPISSAIATARRAPVVLAGAMLVPVFALAGCGNAPETQAHYHGDRYLQSRLLEPHERAASAPAPATAPSVPDQPSTAGETAQLAGAAGQLRVPGSRDGGGRGADGGIIRIIREELDAFRSAATSFAESLPEPAPAAPAVAPDPVLSLPAVALCTEVSGFGSYVPLDPRFTAGKRRKTIVYVEVDQFEAQRAADGRWETKMVFSAQLLDPAGKVVLRVPESPVIDRSRQRRRDFFICADLTLPGTLRPGRHMLVVTVRDELTASTAERRMDLEVVEP